MIRDLIVRLAPYALHAGVAFCVLGMMLVIGSVLGAGLFLPGVVLIVVGILKLAAAAVFSALGITRPQDEGLSR